MDYSRKLKWTFIWLGTLTFAIALPLYLMYWISSATVPISNLANFNTASLNTLGHLAVMQTEDGRYREAVDNFSKYFNLGGQDPKAMESYAEALSSLGQKRLAQEWSEKATRSKAGRFSEELGKE